MEAHATGRTECMWNARGANVFKLENHETFIYFLLISLGPMYRRRPPTIPDLY